MAKPNNPRRDQDPGLLREAGSEHPDGINGRILGAAIIRDSLLTEKGRFPNDAGLNKEIDIWDQRVHTLKTQYHSQDSLPFTQDT